MRPIVWLAAYPKSGNTWLRLMLANLLGDTDQPVPLNDLGLRCSLIASSRTLFDNLVGLASSDMFDEEIHQLRPLAYARLAEEVAESQFVKIHDAYQPVAPDGVPPGEVSAAAIYLVRDPRDVAISFAHHMNLSLDQAIEAMGNETFALAAGSSTGGPQLRQHVGSWSSHVEGWSQQHDIRTLLVRYEDMRANPEAALRRVVGFLGFPELEARIAFACRSTHFDRLAAEETRDGFHGRRSATARFFRRGEVGGWRRTLSDQQARRIEARQRPTMARLGYL